MNFYFAIVAGLYIHIPFCAKVCDYCDFSVLSLPKRMHEEFVKLLLLELSDLKKKFPAVWETIDTLYFGGGTPSLLSPILLRKLFDGINALGISFENLREVSFEMNPETVDSERLSLALSYGIRRFSLGVQTFDDHLLSLVGRSHSSEMALRALDILCCAQNAGAKVSADLMFSLPNQTVESFFSDVRRVLDFGISHLSFYGLNVSEKTVLGERVRRKKISVSDEFYAEMYGGGVEIAASYGLLRYEVSNFSKPSEESVHNQNYWDRGEYLGAGPGAHSFVGRVRFCAPARYSRWKSFVLSGFPLEAYERDELSLRDEIVETIWLSMRQAKGLDLEKLYKDYQYEISEETFSRLIRGGFIFREGSRVKLSDLGFLRMDGVVEELMP